MPRTDESTLAQLRWISAIARRFASALRQGADPAIDHYLEGEGAARTDLLRELVSEHWEYRVRTGTAPSPTRDEYRQWYPELAGWPDEEWPEAKYSPLESTASMPLGGSAESGPDSASARELAPGTLIGEQYQLGDKVAEGGMGIVFVARDQCLKGREVAIKVIRPKLSSARHADRFVREARVTAGLSHPGIPAVHRVGTLPLSGRPFLAMKLIRGTTLDEVLKARPAPAVDQTHLLATFEKVAEAVAFAHGTGTIHRDLKPQNVMVGMNGLVQVVDWGFAKRLGQADEDPRGSVIGTPGYLPPEQARGETPDRRADVFGLGAILAEILTGKPPFVAEDANKDVAIAEMVAMANAGNITECFDRLDKSGADVELVRLCKRCLSPDREQRPADAEKVRKAVEDYRAAVVKRAHTAEADRATAEERRHYAEVKVQAQRRLLRVSLGMTALIVLLGALAWLSESGRRQVEADKKNHDIELAVRDEARAKNVDDGINQLLGRCEEAIRAGNLLVADTAAGEAERLAAETRNDDLRGRVARARRAVRVLTELDEIDDLRWLVEDGVFRGNDLALGRWPGTLRHLGVVVGVTAAATAAATVNDPLVRDRLLATLYLWLALAPDADPNRRWLADVLAAADDDAVRNRMRTALLARDDNAVRDVAASDEVLAQRGWFAVALGSIPAVPEGRRRTILQAAFRDQPESYGLAMTTGLSYPRNSSRTAADRVGWFRVAVALRRTTATGERSVMAWTQLGHALRDAKQLDAAIPVYREVVRLDPRFAAGRNGLANALSERKGEGNLDEAIQEYCETINRSPKYALPHNGLANALRRKGDTPGAIVAFRKAIDLDDKYATPHNGLGNALLDTVNWAEAEASYRAAIERDDKYALPHSNLGRLFRELGDLDRAAAEYREAIRLDPDYASPHNGLGFILFGEGKFDAAAAEYQEAIRLGSKGSSEVENLARKNLARLERARVLLPRLPAVVAGRESPATPDEACEFAYLCGMPFQKRDATAVRLYERAFHNKPAVEVELSSHRYNAACWAVRADGVDAPADAAGRATLRRKGLDWLRAELAVRERQAASADPAERALAGIRLAYWLRDADFRAVRPGLARIELSAEERADWDALWDRVRAAVNRVNVFPPAR